MKISVSEAKGRLTDLVRRAEAGEDVILTRHGEEAVRLVALRPRPDAAGRRALIAALRESAAAKARPGRMTYGTNGPTTLTNVAMLMVMERLGITMQDVTYRGDSAQLAAFLAGDLDMLIVCGGYRSDLAPPRAVLDRLRAIARKGATMGALWNGSCVLARAGLLDGYACTVHPESRAGLEESRPQVRLLPTGGVTVDNAADFIKAGAVAVGVGGELVNQKLLDARDFDTLTARARQFRAAVDGARGR